jgi:polysaccharide export outer membrane protein
MFPTNKGIKSLGLTAVLLLCLSSCKTPADITYFQDLSDGAQSEVAAAKELVVVPNDQISIVVHSKDPQLASLFNIQVSTTNSIGANGAYSSITRTSNGNNQVVVYTVDSYGDIEFPILGTLHVSGMTRTELCEYIKKELIQRNLMKDPTIIIDFYNRTVNVLGDVNKPGKVSINRDRFTVLDAIAEAGDLSIQGKRTNVTVLRMEDGHQIAHKIDLTNASATLNSPVYYLQQNDIVYVEPTDVRKRQTTANGNSLLTPSFWISILSFATTLVLLVKNW